MTANSLTGTIAIVTGAARGLGLAMSTGMVRAGAYVAMADIDADVLDGALKSVLAAGGQGSAEAFPTDVTSVEATERLVATVQTRHGRVDALVNDAAVGPNAIDDRYMTEPSKSWTVDPKPWRLTMDVNVNGPFLMSRAVIPGMLARGFGRIVNVTTSLNTMFQPGCAPYGPSKAALEAYTALLAQELEGTGVTANVLVPGGPANTRMIPTKGIWSEREKLIQPEAMAPPLRWLLSRASDGVNGRRFQAGLWQANLPPEQAAAKASAPAAWPQLGLQAIRPDRPRWQS